MRCAKRWFHREEAGRHANVRFVYQSCFSPCQVAPGLWRSPRGTRIFFSSVSEGFSGRWVQEQLAVFPRSGKVEHLIERTCDRIKRALPDSLTTEPVVLDKSD